jgi:hypothetical protein
MPPPQRKSMESKDEDWMLRTEMQSLPPRSYLIDPSHRGFAQAFFG